MEDPQKHPVHRDAEGPLWSAFDEVVTGRRAIRHFAKKPVAESDMNAVLDAALLAPTSSNLQPFELVWVRDPDARRRLVKACMNQPAARTAAELVVCVARWDHCEDTRRELAAKAGDSRQERFYYDHLVKWVYAMGPLGLFGRARAALFTPALLAVPMPRGPSNRADVRVWATKSAALVAQTFMLAARARGLDTCPMEGADPVRVGKAIGLSRWRWKRSWELSMVLAVGYRDPEREVAPRWRRQRRHLVREV